MRPIMAFYDHHEVHTIFEALKEKSPLGIVPKGL